MDYASVKVDTAPRQATQFARSHAGKACGDYKGHQRSGALSISNLSSDIDGKSTPARKGPLSARSSRFGRTPLATFCATSGP